MNVPITLYVPQYFIEALYKLISATLKFTSQVVASKPAALVQRTNKVPPALAKIVSDVFASLLHYINRKKQQPQDEHHSHDAEHVITHQKHPRIFESPSRSPSPDNQDHPDGVSLEAEELSRQVRAHWHLRENLLLVFNTNGSTTNLWTMRATTPLPRPRRSCIIVVDPEQVITKT